MSYFTKRNLLLLMLIIAIIIEAISALELTLTPGVAIASPDPFVGLVMWVFNWLIPLSPFLLVSFLYLPLVRAAIHVARRRSKSFNQLAEELSSSMTIKKGVGMNSHEGMFDFLERPRLVLILAMIVAALLAYFPYRPDLNPQQTLVGIDAPHYVTAINRMLNEPFPAATTYALDFAWGGSRPLFLLALYSVIEFANLGANVVIRFLPALLAPLLVLSSYYFVWIGGQGKVDASIAALFTAFSPVLTVGIWAGYYPNWLAISEAFTLLGTLLWYLRSPSNSKFAVCILLSLALVLTHLWTWLVVAPVTIIFVFSLRKEIPSRVMLKLAGLILSTYLIAELLKSGLTLGARVIATGELVGGQVANPLSNALAFFPNVVYGVVFTYDGLLATSVLIAFGLVSVIAFRYGDRFERLLLIWVLLTSLAFPFFDDLLQSRLTYTLPIAIMASMGLLRATRNASFKKNDRILTIFLILLFNANYALLAVAHPLSY